MSDPSHITFQETAKDVSQSVIGTRRLVHALLVGTIVGIPVGYLWRERSIAESHALARETFERMRGALQDAHPYR